MSSSRKGDSRERELVDELWDRGWGVVRVPASGSATKKPMPDLVGGDGERYIAFECKSSGTDTIYIKEGEIDGLKKFSDRFGCMYRVAVRFDREEFRFFHPSSLYRTDKGNYRVKKEKALSVGEKLQDIL